jgi:hypothetical protein
MSDDILAILRRLEAGQTRLETDIGKLRADVMARIDRLQETVNATRDDIAVAMGSADQMQRANDNTRADLRTMQEQVSVMWKQIKRLETRVDGIEGGP